MLARGILLAAAFGFGIGIGSANAQPGIRMAPARSANVLTVQDAEPSLDTGNETGNEDGEEGGGILDLPSEVVSEMPAAADGTVKDATGGSETSAAYEACARRFRSFNPNTGTYRAYSGATVTCPYLRD